MNTSTPPPGPGAAPGATPPPPQPDGLDRFFMNLRGAGLFRSDSERWIGGVCGGLAERLRVDPLIIRAAFVLLGLVFGAGVTIYLIAWILLPDRSGAILLQRAMRGGDATAIILVVVVAVVALSGFGLFWGWGGPGPIVPVLLVIGLLIYLLGKQNHQAPSPGTPSPPGGTGTADPATTSPTDSEEQAAAARAPAASPTGSRAVVPFGPERAEVDDPATAVPQYYSATSTTASTPPGVGDPTPPGTPPPAPSAWGPVPPPPPPRPLRRRLGAATTLMLLGLAAIIGSATTLITSTTDISDVPVRLGVAAAAVTVGIGVIAAGFLGRKAGFAAFTGLVLAVVTAAGAAIPRDMSLAGPHGQQSWRPVEATSTSYRMGMGEGQLDLRGLTEPTAKATIKMRAALGELRIIVPNDLSVRVRAHVDGGQITTRELGSTEPTFGTGGADRSRTVTLGPDQPVLTVDADLGFGEIIIERSPS